MFSFIFFFFLSLCFLFVDVVEYGHLFANLWAQINVINLRIALVGILDELHFRA